MPVKQFVYTKDGVLTDILHNGTPWARFHSWNVFKQPGGVLNYRTPSLFWTNITDFTYDRDQRLEGMVVRTANLIPIQSLTYRYDSIGNIVGVTDNRPATGKVANGINTDLTKTYAYDALSRLCAASWSRRRPSQLRAAQPLFPPPPRDLHMTALETLSQTTTRPRLTRMAALGLASRIEPGLH